MPLKTTAGHHGAIAKGRGSPINPEGRFENFQRESVEDGWFQEPEAGVAKPKTVIAIEHAKSVISRHDSPDVNFAQSINPYRGCEHGCVYCMSGDTPVLMANGRTLPLSELRPGYEIYGTTFAGGYHRYAKTRVLDHWSSIKPAYKTTLEDGTELVTSGDHRFLTLRGWKHVTDTYPVQRAHLTTSNKLLGTGAFAEGPVEDDEYRRGYLCGMIRGDGHLESLDLGVVTAEFEFKAAAGQRRAMHGIRTASRHHFDRVHDLIAWPAEPSRQWSIGFLAGIFDAEGSFSQTVLRICNTDSVLIGWICRSLARFDFDFVVEHRDHTDRKPMDVVRLKGGLKEHLRFFHTVRPAITRKLDIEGQALKGTARLRVVRVEPLGKAMRLYDITTGTGDFIANGVVSHNCFARPSHAYLGLSPGIDFETKISAKVNAADMLREEISKRGYRCEPLTVGVNTDAYQPVEREYRITRSVLELAHETDHPVSLITKSALIERDLDLLGPMARKRLVNVTLSITTLDAAISRHMEPRTSAPAARGEAPVRSGNSGQREHRSGHPLPHGLRARADHGGCRREWRQERELPPGSPPLGSEGHLPGLAGGAFPAQGGPCDVPHSRNAERQGQRPPLGHAHDGDGAAGRPAAAEIRQGRQAVRAGGP
jgi:hypothetical protein